MALEAQGEKPSVILEQASALVVLTAKLWEEIQKPSFTLEQARLTMLKPKIWEEIQNLSGRLGQSLRAQL